MDYILDSRIIETVTDVLSTSAIFTNSLLLFVVWRSSCQMGAYKYLLMYFAFFELSYAILVTVGQPVFFMKQFRVIVFCNSRLMNDLGLGVYFAGLYCAFYQMWMVIVAVMFFYRFLVMCRFEWFDTIATKKWIQFVLLAIYIGHVVDCVDLVDQLKYKYDMDPSVKVGYQVTTFHKADDTFSWSGLMNFMNHSFSLNVSILTIFVCGTKVYRTIKEQEGDTSEFKRSKQIFYVLVFQATLPLVMYQIPVMVMFVTLFKDIPLIGVYYSPFLLILTTLPKLLDPVFTLCCIKDYRYAILRPFVYIIGIRLPMSNSVEPAKSQDTQHA